MLLNYFELFYLSHFADRILLVVLEGVPDLTVLAMREVLRPLLPPDNLGDNSRSVLIFLPSELYDLYRLLETILDLL